MSVSTKDPRSPGEALKVLLKERDWTQEDLSYILSISLKHTNEIIKDKKPISLDIAKSLAKVFGKNWPALRWIELGAKFQLENNSEKNDEVQLKADVYKYMPINELIKKRWIKEGEDLDKELRRFWNIPKDKELNLSFLETDRTRLEYRTSLAFEETFNKNNALIWHQMALNFSKTLKAKPFQKKGLAELMTNVHSYTNQDNGIKNFLNELSQVGVKFVFLTHLSKTYLDGAAFLSPEGPVVTLTGRYDRIDNFWFTLAHELSHVALHLTKDEKESIFIDFDSNKKSTSKKEQEANESAERVLLQPDILEHFENDTNYITEEKVIEFSAEMDIHPSIVVGLLQHNELVSYSTLHRFKEPVRDEIPEKYKADPWNLF